MSKEFFDAEAQQHAADLDIVRELRHSDASLYQLAHGRGARWQFNQLKSQLEEKDAMIAELESSLRLLTLKAQSESEIQSLKQQLESARTIIRGLAFEGSTAKLGKPFPKNEVETLMEDASKWLEENK